MYSGGRVFARMHIGGNTMVGKEFGDELRAGSVECTRSHGSRYLPRDPRSSIVAAVSLGTTRCDVSRPARFVHVGFYRLAPCLNCVELNRRAVWGDTTRPLCFGSSSCPILTAVDLSADLFGSRALVGSHW